MVHKRGFAIGFVVVKEVHIVEVCAQCGECAQGDGRMQVLGLLAAQQLNQLRQLLGHRRGHVAH